jgi:hypothetical protein
MLFEIPSIATSYLAMNIVNSEPIHE